MNLPRFINSIRVANTRFFKARIADLKTENYIKMHLSLNKGV